MLLPIPYFYDHIDRSAIIIMAKKPFFDWINTIDPENPITKTEEDNVYLIKEKDDSEEIEKWLKRNFDKIFQNELNDWYTDETVWPQKRTFKLFTEWFEYKTHAIIIDIEDAVIRKY